MIRELFEQDYFLFLVVSPYSQANIPIDLNFGHGFRSRGARYPALAKKLAQ